MAMLPLLSLLLICYGIGNTRCSTVPGNTKDMLSLLDFKRAITSDPSQALSSWNTSIHHCQWEGVNCSLKHTGRVTALDLTGQNLQGQIAPSLGNLTFLRSLDLSSNRFFGQLPTLNHLRRLQFLILGKNMLQGFDPDALRNCSNLQYLDLSLNSLTGSIPHKIGLLSGLLTLSLVENNFTGTIPSSLRNITLLEQINLELNHLEGSIPQELGHLSNLVVLELGENSLTGKIPRIILNHSTLEMLDLHSNFLHMELPSNIGNTLPNLSWLFLYNNMFQGQIPDSLGNLLQLEYIDFTSNNFSGQVPSSLGRLINLKYLKLEQNMLEADDNQSWEFLDALSNCRSLRVLSLYDNQLQGAIPNSIGNLTQDLVALGLDKNNLSGTVPESIGNLTGLSILLLSENNLSGQVGSWIGNLRNMGALSLSYNNFSGPIPFSIGGLIQMWKLFLNGNKFEGPIPPSLGNLPFLSLLNLSQNNLNGHIPLELFSPLSTITTCIVSYNNLEGPIPPEVSNLKQLVDLQISSNKLNGEIPSTLSECQELQILLMDKNFLTGNIPRSLSSLKSLSVLNLSYNILSGFIPIELSNLSFLTQLDLSNNSLQGEIPREGVFGNVTAVSLGGNWGLCGGILGLNMPLCHVISQRSETEYYLIRVLIPILGFTSLLMLAYLVTMKRTSGGTYKFVLSFGRQFPRVTYKDLNQATESFSAANLLGQGSYGSVYRGKLTQAKIEVAIKVFHLDIKCADKSFVTECEVLRNIRHRNLLPILTACSTIDNNGEAFKALVYELMPNGNLDSWLHNKTSGSCSKCLSLAQRASIAIGIADALAYLHHDCERQIVHCDLKPTNILLDDGLNAYLGDFGIASLVGHSSSNTAGGLKGTIGYIAPEYAQTGQASIRGDVYSFGIVLLEMLIGKRPTDPLFENEHSMVNFVERNYPDQVLLIIDARLDGECKRHNQANTGIENAGYKCLLLLVQVALSCTRLIPGERMSIREVTTKLHSIRTSYITTNGEQAMLC
ncbi:putative LRR receptor-like serine/threonine-protein kinase [Hordeum vulgare]|nr:putative LRR receptor-like serine/threonine-protein kinase [Hordeum vulgare]